jgi:sigma-54 dependent transcriptional regulator, acetoin dehydrogenase operon transcriptional activator AcoR
LGLSPDVAALLARCPWPGNVRQLFNVLRTACVMAMGEHSIRREHLPDDFLDEVSALEATPAFMPQGRIDIPAAAAQAAAVPAPAMAHSTAGRSLDDIEIDAIRRALDAARGNISEAAKCLGISRNTIYRKLRWNERA